MRAGARAHGTRRTVRAGAAAATVLVLVACGTGSEAGFGTPTQQSVGEVPGERTDVEGVLRVEANGCFTLELDDGTRPWIVWPEGTTMDADVVVPGTTRATDGDRLAGRGVLVDASALPGWENADSYAHAFGAFCDAAVVGVVALDEVDRR
ncbi:hypothetical protein GXP71_07515 [Cellulomonas sp. H30R-01]|uniref:hypothetical protein n=1 Tax=Cellulomonas sp. H30R-01 TaxID=2704467 RepID=UPI00138C31E1|nr:hypothetical protein [Cellulomonas sp. H30R-01]QHT55936.1 hypothetical protein GXP71_07515 [Cellulomonas sp. H30R-01]